MISLPKISTWTRLSEKLTSGVLVCQKNMFKLLGGASWCLVGASHEAPTGHPQGTHRAPTGCLGGASGVPRKWVPRGCLAHCAAHMSQQKNHVGKSCLAYRLYSWPGKAACQMALAFSSAQSLRLSQSCLSRLSFLWLHKVMVCSNQLVEFRLGYMHEAANLGS